MKWTKQVPTVDGWYFVRRKYPRERGYSVQPVYILRLDDGEMYYKYWYNCIEGYGDDIEIEAKVKNFSWFAGPLPEPEKAEEERQTHERPVLRELRMEEEKMTCEEHAQIEARLAALEKKVAFQEALLQEQDAALHGLRDGCAERARTLDSLKDWTEKRLGELKTGFDDLDKRLGKTIDELDDLMRKMFHVLSGMLPEGGEEK